MSGLIMITPSSIAITGGGSESATINANGSVSVSLVTGIELRGVFSSTYTNYRIQFIGTGFGSTRYQWLNGTSKITGTDYTRQNLNAANTTISAARSTSQDKGTLSATTASDISGFQAQIYVPNLAQNSYTHGTSAFPFDGGYVAIESSSHALTTAYDGIYLFPSGPTDATGDISIFGWEE